MANHQSAVRPPTLEDLKSVAEKHHLNVSQEDLLQYKDHMVKLLSIYDLLDKSRDQCLPVRYTSDPGYRPMGDENKYNAWAHITNTKGASSGKLFGKTVAIKDNISMAGVEMTIGSAFMEGFVSKYNATVVDRVLDAGAIIKGKTVCEDMCYTGGSFTSVTGPVLNPHDLTRDAGGSSSGSAAVVAAGEVDMALGTDQGGSIRIPASRCGIVGLKPTHGLVPYTGIVPLESTLDFVGPMTKTVKDCALLLEVLAGCDFLDPRQPSGLVAKKYADFLTGDLDGFHVGLLTEGFDRCEPDVAELVKSVAQKLTNRGAIVDNFSSPLHDAALAVATVILIEGTYATFVNGGITPLHMKGFKDVTTNDFMFKAAQNRADSLPIGVKLVLLHAGVVQNNHGCRFYAKAQNQMRSIVAGYDELFARYDVIIMPTSKCKPSKLPINIETLTVNEFLEVNLSESDNTMPYNATGHPAVSVNAGFSEGLPVGLMIVGRHWEDEKVLQVAHTVELVRD